MILAGELLMETALEHILISSYKAGMISYMHAHPENFEEAVKLAVSDKQPYCWRAASLLWSYMEKNDLRMQKHIKNIVRVLINKNDGHQRELLNILFRMDLKKENESILFDICMTIWESINKKPSVRFTALKFIVKIVKNHPELSHEIDFLTQDHYMELLSPGIKKSISKMINGFILHK